MGKPPSWVILADDLTGACDTGAAFAGQGWSVRVGLTTAVDCAGTEVWACTTESRVMSETQAGGAVVQAAQRLKMDARSRLYKKIDSTLRGHPGAELAALMNALGIEKALVCPAFPQQGRVVRDGRVFVRGIALGESEFAEKPRASDLEGFFTPYLPCYSMHLADVRSGAASVKDFLERPGVTIADAETIDDLKILAEAGERAGMRLYCGSAGLGGALASVARKADAQHRRKDLPEPQPGSAIFIVVGSRSRASINQCEYLRARGIRTLWLSTDDAATQRKNALAEDVQSQILLISAGRLEPMPGGELQIAAALAELAKTLLVDHPAGGMILTGGDTAAAVCRALDCSAIDLHGELQPGLGWGVMVDGSHANLPVVTKAGGFGRAETLMQALDFLLSLQRRAEV